MQEPDFFLDESDFQSKTLDCVLRANPSLESVSPFGLDAVFIVPGTNPLRFFEFKVFTGQRPLGVPFGKDRTQVQLLSLSESALVILDALTRWCFADLRQGRSARRYAVLTASQARASAMGGVKSGKENNFNINRVMASALDWTSYLERIDSFLAAQSGNALAASK